MSCPQGVDEQFRVPDDDHIGCPGPGADGGGGCGLQGLSRRGADLPGIGFGLGQGQAVDDGIGEEATEVVMAAKDADHGGDRSKIVGEVADLWFHCMIALAHYGLTPSDVVAELERREGTSGIEEKALRKAQAREVRE